FERDEGVERFMGIIEGMGVEKALRKAGIAEGDTVIIGPMEFDYFE
ncbi:MAG: Obg family GTPase CgtA, partial [Peptococcus niger]